MPKTIDLSMPIKAHWRWPAELTAKVNYDNGHPFRTTWVTLSNHGFTHIDSALHYFKGRPSVPEMPLEHYVGRATVIDVSHRGANEGVTAEDLEEHGQHVQEGDIVLLRTDWPLKCPYESREFWGDAPYTTAGACEWLVARKVRSVGYDYPPDVCIRDEVRAPETVHPLEDYTTHSIFFPAGIMVIEYLVNLHLLPEKAHFQFVAAPLPVQCAEGSPVRALAFLE